MQLSPGKFPYVEVFVRIKKPTLLCICEDGFVVSPNICWLSLLRIRMSVCQQCHDIYIRTSNRRMYCKKACARLAKTCKQREHRVPRGLPHGTVEKRDRSRSRKRARSIVGGQTRVLKRHQSSEERTCQVAETIQYPDGTVYTSSSREEVRTFMQTEFSVENKWEEQVQNSMMLLKNGREEDLLLKTCAGVQISEVQRFLSFAQQSRVFQGIKRNGITEYVDELSRPKQISLVAMLDWREIVRSGVILTNRQMEEIVFAKLVEQGSRMERRDHAGCVLEGCWQGDHCPDTITLLDFEVATTIATVQVNMYVHMSDTRRVLSLVMPICGVDEYFLRWAFRSDEGSSRLVVGRMLHTLNRSVEEQRYRTSECGVMKKLGLQASLLSQ